MPRVGGMLYLCFSFILWFWCLKLDAGEHAWFSQDNIKSLYQPLGLSDTKSIVDF